VRHSVAMATLGGLLIAGLTVDLGGFGDPGHRVVGSIAEMHLRNTRAIKEVRKILRANETLADAAVWPDTIKSPLYEDEDTAPFRLEHPGHEIYHYTNLPFQVDAYAAGIPGARAADIVQISRECIRVLRGTSTLFERREAVRMLAHLVGDIHQPLHVGNAFVSADQPLRFVVPKGSTGWRSSLGGNTLVYGPQDRFNLHSYWDAHAVNLVMGADDVSTLAGRLFQDLPVMPGWIDQGDAETWPERWAGEALELAKAAHHDVKLLSYLGADETGRVPHRWRIQQPAGYDDRSRSIVRIQLAKGGYRLAATLEAIWPAQ
jgi:hypothetical protein